MRFHSFVRINEFGFRAVQASKSPMRFRSSNQIVEMAARFRAGHYGLRRNQ
jgi:hypothetical protein